MESKMINLMFSWNYLREVSTLHYCKTSFTWLPEALHQQKYEKVCESQNGLPVNVSKVQVLLFLNGLLVIVLVAILTDQWTKLNP